MLTSNEKRNILKRAITAHDGWENYRASFNLTASQITSFSQALDICRALRIDADALIFEAEFGGEMTDEEHDEIREQFEGVRAEKRAPVQEAPDDLTGALVALKKALGGSVDADAVRAIVEEAIAPLKAIVENQAPVILVQKEGVTTGKVEGLRHKMFDTLLRAMMSRDASGRYLQVWLSGPTQSGKTTAAKMVADAMGLDFAFHGAMNMSHELIGFVDAGGNYHSTQFVNAYRDGGLVLVDEVDAGSNEALLTLNAALANGEMALPTGEMLPRHPDFACIAAANTWGQGATAEYIGRTKIDEAFLQRFPVKIFWDYDAKLEEKMCGNPDFARRVQRARDQAISKGLKVKITPAHSKAGAALIASGFSEDEAADLTYLAGLSEDQRKQVGA